MSEYKVKVQIVKQQIIERTIEAKSPEEAERIAKERYRYFVDGLVTVQITADVICERDE